MSIKDEFLTTNQVTDRLGVTRSTVYRWVREGKLPKYSVGSKNFFRPSDIESMVKIMDEKHFVSQGNIEEPSDEELNEARLAFNEIEQELKSGDKMTDNEDIMQMATEILEKSHLISKARD